VSTYQIVSGHNNAGSLADVSIQPRSEPAKYGRVQIGGDQLAYADGSLRTAWVYNSLTESNYSTLLTEFGFSSESTMAVKVTVKTKNSARTFANYNAIIYRPEPSFGYFMKRTSFSLVLVEAL